MSRGSDASKHTRRRRRNKARSKTHSDYQGVEALQHRLSKISNKGAGRRKARTAKPKARNASSFPILSATQRKPRTTVGRRRVLRGDGLDDMFGESTTPHVLDVGLQGACVTVHSHSLLFCAAGVGPSEEKWIPLESRLKMLKREMEAFKMNNDRETRHLEDLHKAQPRQPELSLAKMRERYSGKKKKRCSLCEQSFALVNLPLSISYKAVMDLRTRFVALSSACNCVACYVGGLIQGWAHSSYATVLCVRVQLGRGRVRSQPSDGTFSALLQRSPRLYLLCPVL